MAAATPFEGMATENPYRHIRHFMTLCNTVRQEGVPDEWFKWNLFPYSLAGEAMTWYSFASFEVEGNWNKLTKKFCKKFFLVRKVQHLRRQVNTFMQGEEEGIDQDWNRFNEFIEQGPRLGFSSWKPLNFYKRLVKRRPCKEIRKQDLRESWNTIQG
jgi:hypothetical protein